jgi:hypothetical protein
MEEEVITEFDGSLFPLYHINGAILGHWVFPMSMFYQPL